MSIVARVGDYLDAQHIHYEVIQHGFSNSSIDSARSARISPMKLAKAVILEDHEGRHMMAVLPSMNKIRLHRLTDEFQREFHLIPERRVYKMFDDCEPGAVPPIGRAYNMEAVYDDLLEQQKDVFMEAGDHQTLIHLKQDAFKKLVADCPHGRFSGEVFH